MEYESLIQDELGNTVGQRLAVFYTYDGLLGSRDQECIHGSLNDLIELFQSFRLAANVAKSKTMI